MAQEVRLDRKRLATATKDRDDDGPNDSQFKRLRATLSLTDAVVDECRNGASFDMAIEASSTSTSKVVVKCGPSSEYTASTDRLRATFARLLKKPPPAIHSMRDDLAKVEPPQLEIPQVAIDVFTSFKASERMNPYSIHKLIEENRIQQYESNFSHAFWTQYCEEQDIKLEPTSVPDDATMNNTS